MDATTDNQVSNRTRVIVVALCMAAVLWVALAAAAVIGGGSSALETEAAADGPGVVTEDGAISKPAKQSDGTTTSITDATTAATATTATPNATVLTTAVPPTTVPPTTVARATSGNVTTTPTSTTPTSTSSTSSSSTTQAPPATGVPEGDSTTVDHPLWRVVNVAHNDELNVRTGASTANDIVGTLPPAAQGVTATGVGLLLANGAEWIQIEASDFSPAGWVNGFYLDPMDADSSFDALPCAVGSIQTTLDAAEIESPPANPVTVDAIDHLFGPCERTIIELSANRFPGVPQFATTDAGVSVSLPGLLLAHVAENADASVFIARSTQGEIEAEFLTRASSFGMTLLTDPARIVVDRPAAVGGPEATENGVVIRTFTGGDGQVTMPAMMTGLARPFEAHMAMRIVDAAGNDVTAIWTGGIWGPMTTDDVYPVMTTDWSSAWGRFAIAVDGLAPGDYRLVASQDGGDEGVASEFAFTVTL